MSGHEHFNPRSREGSDFTASSAAVTKLFISIHAPARGATFTGDPLNVLSTDFNPRSREGSDQTMGKIIDISK